MEESRDVCSLFHVCAILTGGFGTKLVNKRTRKFELIEAQENPFLPGGEYNRWKHYAVKSLLLLLIT